MKNKTKMRKKFEITRSNFLKLKIGMLMRPDLTSTTIIQSNLCSNKCRRTPKKGNLKMLFFQSLHNIWRTGSDHRPESVRMCACSFYTMSVRNKHTVFYLYHLSDTCGNTLQSHINPIYIHTLHEYLYNI